MDGWTEGVGGTRCRGYWKGQRARNDERGQLREVEDWEQLKRKVSEAKRERQHDMNKEGRGRARNEVMDMNAL